jgi:hypothetical protein
MAEGVSIAIDGPVYFGRSQGDAGSTESGVAG